MKRVYQALVGGFTAVVIGVGALPVMAQSQGRMTAFTPEEWEIISRAYHRNPDRNIGQQQVHMLALYNWQDVVKRGGSGRNRWVVLNLGTDQFGNRYFLNTQERMKVAIDRVFVRTPEGRLVPEERIYPVVQILFAGPPAQNGVVQRKVAMSTNCTRLLDRERLIQWQMTYLLDSSDSPIAYKDYDRNGNVVESRNFSSSEKERISQQSNIQHHLEAACYAAYTYPALLDLLAEGQNNPNVPSLYDPKSIQK